MIGAVEKGKYKNYWLKVYIINNHFFSMSVGFSVTSTIWTIDESIIHFFFLSCSRNHKITYICATKFVNIWVIICEGFCKTSYPLTIACIKLRKIKIAPINVTKLKTKINLSLIWAFPIFSANIDRHSFFLPIFILAWKGSLHISQEGI